MFLRRCLARSMAPASCVLKRPSHASGSTTAQSASSIPSTRSQRCSISDRVSARTACVGVAVLGAIEALVLPRVIPSFLAFELPVRVLFAGAFIAPLGVLMGVPFPSGLRRTGQGELPAPPFYWGLNGVLSVIGSVTTVFVALLFGFQIAMLVGAAVYLVAAGASFKTGPSLK